MVKVIPEPVASISPVSVVQRMHVTLEVHPKDLHGVPCVADSVVVTLHDPLGEEKEISVQFKDDGYRVSFVGEPGEYTIHVLINGQAARDCPFVFTVPAYEKGFEVTSQFTRLQIRKEW
eukprot:TRINITY_DN12251_c0_g1_i1.p1 TRINITY_DN12251_c0_g1~~TRINITY_DN12251_c0_g1_i1.p1  ORF type:complete len:119 (-),score=25.03 TRINITY_DN12251_c0_g1_i1:152-508(-)